MTDPTPIDFWTYAREFFDAGCTVRRSVASQVSMPAYFLFGQSIELALKAFLLGRGLPLKVLTSKEFGRGHDLLALLKESRRRRLGLEVKLDSIEVGTISLLNYEYHRHRYRYSRKDVDPTMYIPLPDLTERAAKKLVRGLRSYCQTHSTA